MDSSISHGFWIKAEEKHNTFGISVGREENFIAFMQHFWHRNENQHFLESISHIGFSSWGFIPVTGM